MTAPHTLFFLTLLVPCGLFHVRTFVSGRQQVFDKGMAKELTKSLSAAEQCFRVTGLEDGGECVLERGIQKGSRKMAVFSFKPAGMLLLEAKVSPF